MTRRVLVEVLAGPSVGETYEHREESILVGRGSNCQLQVTSPHVSRQQCELIWQGDQLVLENLGTVNVTYLNDRPIERVYVQDGDLITFCDVALRVRIPRAAGQVTADPDRTVAFDKGKLPSSAPPGHPVPTPGSDSTVIRSSPPGQDTHPPGPLGGLPPGPPPPVHGAPGGLGTGTYGHSSGQHPAHERPGAPPPRSAPLPPPPPSNMVGTQKFQAGLHLQGLPGQPPAPAPPIAAPAQLGSQTRMPPLPPQGMPAGRRPGGMGPAPGMPGPPQGMPGGAPGQPHGHPRSSGGPPVRAGAQSVDRPKKKRKRKGKSAANLPLIRNVVLAAAAIIVLLAFAYALTQPGGGGGTEPPTEMVEVETPPTIPVKPADDPRTDEEIIREGQKLFGTGSTYLREYRIADENLWTAKEYMERAQTELYYVPSEKWPPFAPEIEQKLAETEGLLDQEFRRLKLAYVREKSAGNYERAMEELERLQRVFPSKDDQRHLFARKQKKALNKLMSGGGSTSYFGR